MITTGEILILAALISGVWILHNAIVDYINVLMKNQGALNENITVLLNNQKCFWMYCVMNLA